METDVLILLSSHPFSRLTRHRYDDLAAKTHLPKELKGRIPDSNVCRTAYHVRCCC